MTFINPHILHWNGIGEEETFLLLSEKYVKKNSKLIELKIKLKYQTVGSEIRIVHHMNCYEDNDFLGFVVCALKLNVGCLRLEVLI